MKKASIKLFDLHSSFKVKFTTFILTENQIQNKGYENKSVVNKYLINGNTYLSLTPNSYVVVDISTKQDKGENYSNNTSFSMDRRRLFMFVLRLERLYRCFTEEKELFFFDSNLNNELTINHNIAERLTQTVTVNGGKVLQMAPCVMTTDKGEKYESIYISVNNLNYYTYVTYDQLLFLITELKKIDFSTLEMGLITTYLFYKDKESKELKLKPSVQVKESEIVDSKKKVFIEDESIIPDI